MTQRILIVEDTEDNQRILIDLLTASGYAVVLATDGEAGVAAAAKERPDLILMDVQMPLIDGFEATRRIKADPGTRHIPVVAVTSYALSGDEARATDAGCDGYVSKPFSPRKILAMVKAFLHEGRGPAA